MNPGATHYLNRMAEHLVIQGYRNWLDGCASRDARLLASVWSLHATRLGPTQGRSVLDGLVSFVRTLGRCATCPLRYAPADAGHLCRDECLVLSLVAGLQHGDDKACDLSVAALVCPSKIADTLSAAGDYAMRLKTSNCTLMPISGTIVADILATAAARDERGPTTTLH